jgi:hypothetical protein
MTNRLSPAALGLLLCFAATPASAQLKSGHR